MGWSHFREANGLDDDAKPAIDVSCAGSLAIGTYQFRHRSEIESFSSEISPLDFTPMASEPQVVADSEQQSAGIITLAQAMDHVVC